MATAATGQAAAPATSATTAAPAAPAAAQNIDPVARIQAILDREKAPPSAESQSGVDPEAQPADDSPAGDYEPGPNKVAEGEDAKEEENQTDETTDTKPAMAEIPLDQLEAVELEVTVKGDDGKDIVEKPTIKELREGYMRQKDYSRKTAEVARQREEVGEKVRQAIESERNEYVKNLEVLQATLIETVAPELKNVDWNALATNDAFEYVRLRNRADQITQAIGTIQAKAKEATAKQEAEQRAAIKTRAAKAIETLEQKIPGWNDALYQTLLKAGEPYGYKAEEIGTWLDPRSIQVLHDAYQFRQMKAPAATKKVVVAPKVVKPGSSNVQTQVQQRAQEAMRRLQGSGSVDDAAAVISARMGARRR